MQRRVPLTMCRCTEGPAINETQLMYTKWQRKGHAPTIYSTLRDMSMYTSSIIKCSESSNSHTGKSFATWAMTQDVSTDTQNRRIHILVKRQDWLWTRRNVVPMGKFVAQDSKPSLSKICFLATSHRRHVISIITPQPIKEEKRLKWPTTLFQIVYWIK